MTHAQNRSILRLVTSLIVMLLVSVTFPARAENSATKPAPGGGERWFQRHQRMCDRAKQGNVDLVFIGDSIVGNWAYDGEPVWNHYYEKRHGLNLGISGDRTEQVLWRLDHGNLEGISPKLAIVMIGQNNGPFNTAEEIAAGVTAIVQKIQAKTPNTKILLLGIFYRGEKPNPEQKKLDQTNAIIAKLADDKQIFFMNVNKIFLLPDGTISKELMEDFEHPTEKGFQRWAESIELKVAQLMGEPVPTTPTASPAK